MSCTVRFVFTNGSIEFSSIPGNRHELDEVYRQALSGHDRGFTVRFEGGTPSDKASTVINLDNVLSISIQENEK